MPSGYVIRETAISIKICGRAQNQLCQCRLSPLPFLNHWPSDDVEIPCGCEKTDWEVELHIVIGTDNKC